MRCLQCNAEMTLIGAVPADATLPGFEHHTFLCSACNEIERRLLFTGTKSLPSSSTWTRAVEKLVSKQKALKEEQALAKKSSDQAYAREAPQQRTDCESTPRCTSRQAAGTATNIVLALAGEKSEPLRLGVCDQHACSV